MMRLWGLVLLVAVSGAAADTLGEQGRFNVKALGEQNFEVIRLQHMAAAELWCAAANHVERTRGLAGTTPIYVRRPLGPAQTVPGRKSVIFSLNNAGLPKPQDRLTLTVSEPGEMMKAVQARRYCRDAFTRSTK